MGQLSGPSHKAECSYFDLKAQPLQRNLKKSYFDQRQEMGTVKILRYERASLIRYICNCKRKKYLFLPA